MRITACRIEAFGPFQARVFDALDAPVIVVQGPNEAGKTSLARFVQDMLYGIAPPEAAGHPYALAEAASGKGAPPLGGQLRYRLADGTQRMVHRRLTSAPQARLTEAGTERTLDLQNRPLPAVAGVPRAVFSALGALRGATLGSAVPEDVWESVQEQLLRTAPAPSVRSAEAAAEELEADAAHLWQPPEDGQGAADARTEATRFLARRCDLREKLDRARAHDRECRALHQSMDEHDRQLEALADEQAMLKARLRQAERLRPVQALVVEMEAHERLAGDLSPFDDVPDAPGPVLRRLGHEIEHYEREAARNEKNRADFEAARDAFGDDDRRVRAEADAIRAWGRSVGAHEKRAAHREHLLRGIEELGQVLDERAERYFGTPWSASLAGALRALPEEKLETQVAAYREAAGELEALEVRADALARKVDRRKRFWPWVGAIVVGLAAFAAGLAWELPLLWGPGVGLVASGFLQVLSVWNYNRERGERLGELDLEIEEKGEARNEKGAAIAALLTELPLSEDARTRPEPALVEALRDLRRQGAQRDVLQQQAEAVADILGQAEASVASLARRAGVEQAEAAATVPQAVAALEDRLEEAQARHRRAEDATARLADLRRRDREIEPALTERCERLDTLKARLRTLDDDLDAARKTLQERRRAARHAEHARETLFREYPDWKTLREEIRTLEDEEDGWSYTDAEVVRMRERRAAAADEVQAIEEERARKQERAEQLCRMPAPADVASTLADVERRLETTRRRRDRLMLLAGVVRQAGERARYQRQPDAVKQASRYLRTITGGRYHHLLLEEGAQRRLSICRTKEAPPQYVAEAPLSRGLRAQVHVALRLALLDHLDQSQEALPLFLDEVFATWDRRRRQQGYSILEELAERRQVFVFTSHPALSGELHHRLGARRLVLDGPSEGL